jgi:glycosyltransferase involved in cell wall biosynthesis
MKNNIAFLGVKYFPSAGGTSRVVENIIKNLAQDYHITLYCYKNKLAGKHMKGIRTIQIPQIPLGSIGVFLYYLFCTLHLLLFGKYDLVHVHKIDAAIFIPLLKRKFRIVATSHESPYLRDKWSWLGRKYFFLCENIFINSSVTLTTISKPLSRLYKERFKVQVRYIPNGISFESNLNYDAADSILKKHEIKDNFLMFAARRIMSSKGIHTFLSSLEYIDFKGSVLIAGDTSHSPRLVKKLINRHRGLDIKLTGYIGSLKILLALVEKADLFIFPSETEGMSIMLLEVASVGTPVICSDIPENREVFTDEEVTYFKNKDHIDLGKKIIEADMLKKDLELKAGRAILKIKSRYSWERISKEYNSLYRSIIGSDKKKL